MLLLTRMSEEEPPAVDASHPPGPQPVWWQRVLEANGITVVALIGAAVWVAQSITKVETRVDALEKSLEQHRHFHETGVGSSGTEKKAEPPTTEPSAVTPTPAPEPAPSASDSSEPEPVKVAPPTMDKLPPDATLEQPPRVVCVTRRTYRPLPCDSAAGCYPAKDFKPALLQDLRTKYHASDVRVCE